MQALAVGRDCGCAQSSLVPGFDLEILSVTSLGDSNKALSRCVRGFRSGCGRKFELKCKLFSVYRIDCVGFLANPKKSSLASFPLTWALETLSVPSGLSDEESQSGQNDDSQLNDVKFLDDESVKKDIVEGSETGDSDRIDVRALAVMLQSAQTADDVEELLDGKTNLPLQVYSTVICGLGREKKLESAMAVFEWLKRKGKETDGSLKPNLFIYNSLLGAMKRAEKPDHVEELRMEMEAENVAPNVVTYNILMGIYIEQGEEIKGIELFHEMQVKGIVPSPASYSTVLNAYRRIEDGFGALEFFVETRNRYYNGEVVKGDDGEWDYEFPKLENFTIRICYQVMRRWLVGSENLSTKLIKLLREMDKSELKLDHESLEKLIWACTQQDHCAVARELYIRIREMDSEISLSVCNHVIWLLGKAKKWWAALEIYEDMLDRGPKPNNMSYELVVSHFNILLSVARKKGIWRWGVKLLNKMEEKGLKPSSKEWNSVLVACSKAAEPSAAIEIFKRMVENGEKPTIISYGALLSALEKGKLYDEAIQVWKHITKMGVEPNLYAYTIMASVYASLGKFDIVDSIIREMASFGIQPTVVTFNAVISSCAKINLGSSAYQWFQRMKAENIAPNEISYEVLIEALAKDGKPRLAYELHLRALNEGLVLSTKAYDAVVTSAEMFGATIDTAAFGSRPQKIVQIR